MQIDHFGLAILYNEASVKMVIMPSVYKSLNNMNIIIKSGAYILLATSSLSLYTIGDFEISKILIY